MWVFFLSQGALQHNKPAMFAVLSIHKVQTCAHGALLKPESFCLCFERITLNCMFFHT